MERANEKKNKKKQKTKTARGPRPLSILALYIKNKKNEWLLWLFVRSLVILVFIVSTRKKQTNKQKPTKTGKTFLAQRKTRLEFHFLRFCINIFGLNACSSNTDSFCGKNKRNKTFFATWELGFLVFWGPQPFFFFEQTDRKSLQRIQFVFFLFFQGSSPNLFVCLFIFKFLNFGSPPDPTSSWPRPLPVGPAPTASWPRPFPPTGMLPSTRAGPTDNCPRNV